VVLDERLGTGLGIAPIAVGGARPRGPDFPHAIVSEFGPSQRIDHSQPMARLADAATHDRAACTRLGTIGGQCQVVDSQAANALASRTAGNEQCGLRQSVGRHEGIRYKTARGEFPGEAFQGVEANRFGAGIRHPPATEVELRQGRLADPLAAQPVSKIRPAADGTAVLADRFEPTQRARKEVSRRHQYTGHATEDRLQQATDQSHVVVQRQPADDHVIGVQIDAKALADQRLVCHQIAVADLHTFRHRRGAGGVLQESDMLVLHRGLNPLPGEHAVECVDAQQRRRSFDLPQGVAQAGAGQQQAWLGIADDRQQAFLMMTPA